MDSIKEKLLHNNISKELLLKINDHLDKIVRPSILITSHRMTDSIISNGIQQLYQDKINFIHTLSSPICYTAKSDIDKIINWSQDSKNIICLKDGFEDLIKLQMYLSRTTQDLTNIKFINREIEGLKIAKDNPERKVILVSSGFETEIPNIAGCILEAKKDSISNMYVLLLNKLIIPAIKNLLNRPIKIDSYIAPGDISIVVGLKTFEFITNEYKKPVSIGGFDAISILCSIESVLNMLVNKEVKIINNYSNLVNQAGNQLAQEKMYEVLTPKTIEWEGYGLIPFSGLTFTSEYSTFDALNKFEHLESELLPGDCICKNILAAKSLPANCNLFKNECTPEKPRGLCMMLKEGLCSIVYNSETRVIPDVESYSRLID
ncbi:MAG: hydrogenase formation protein HypD [Cyanobacteriota bacterium]